MVYSELEQLSTPFNTVSLQVAQRYIGLASLKTGCQLTARQQLDSNSLHAIF